MRNIRTQLAKGSLWLSGAKALTNFFSFVSTIVLARLLVPADFGLVALAATMLAVVTAATDLSVASAVLRHENPTDEHMHTAWTLSMARGILLAALFCLSAHPLALAYSEPRLDNVMYVLSLNLIVNGFANPRLIMMQKRLVFWQVFAMNVTKDFIMVVISVLIAFLYHSYWALVAGAVAGQVASTCLSYALFPYRPRPCVRHTRELLSFSIWLTLGQIANTLSFRIDHLLIGGYLGRTSLGYYTVGTNLGVAPSREMVLPLTKTLFPAFSAVSDNRERLRRGYQRAQATVTAVALPAGVGFALVADPFVRLAMGAKWLPAIPLMQIVSATYAFSTLGSLIGPLAMAAGATRYLFKRSFQLLLVRLPCIVTGMYFGGLIGLIYGAAVAGLLNILNNMRMVQILIGLPIIEQLRANLRCFIATAAMTTAVLLLQRALPDSADSLGQTTEIAAMIAVGAASYLATSFLLWRAAGRPIGPEREAIELGQKMLGRLKRHRTVDARAL